MPSERLSAAYADYRRRGGVVDLQPRVKLSFSGADRVRFLNGQVSANVAAAKPRTVLPACVTTAKGKLCADVFVTVSPEAVIIDADPALSEALQPRLERYIVADDVTVADVSATAGLVHAIGIAPEELATISGASFVEVNRFGRPGFDLFSASRAELEPTWRRLTEAFPILEEELIEIIRVEQGVPRWGRELDEDTLPQEAALDRTHVDFHKGCYVGQEVISRLESVGRVNRQLTGFLGERAIPAGAEIYAGADPGRPCGTITSACWSFALERPIALGYLRRSAPVGEFFARSAEAGAEPVPITVCELPFTK